MGSGESEGERERWGGEGRGCRTEAGKSFATCAQERALHCILIQDPATLASCLPSSVASLCRCPCLIPPCGGTAYATGSSNATCLVRESNPNPLQDLPCSRGRPCASCPRYPDQKAGSSNGTAPLVFYHAQNPPCSSCSCIHSSKSARLMPLGPNG